MVRLTITKDVAAPVETVFDISTDFHNLADTVKAIEKVEVLTDGPVGVGTRFRETRIMFKKEATEEMEVTALERPQRLALLAESHGSRYETEYRYSPTPDGKGTHIEFVFDATPVTLMAKVMSVVMRPLMKTMANMCSKDLDDVKALAEARA